MIKNESLVISFEVSFLYLTSFSLGGRNGYGAKVTNIFSKKFTIETCSKEFKKLFKQVNFPF